MRSSNPLHNSHYSGRPSELGKGLIVFFLFALWPMWGLMLLSLIGGCLK